MRVGERAELTRVFSQQDLLSYSVLSGHKISSDRVPEPLIGALFSQLLGVNLPGLGTNYLKQESRYCVSASVGERLLASVEITRIRADKHLVDLRTLCCRPDGQVVADGRALVYTGQLKNTSNHED